MWMGEERTGAHARGDWPPWAWPGPTGFPWAQRTLECSWARAIFLVSHQERCLPAGRALLMGLKENGQRARARMPMSGNRAVGRPHRVFQRIPAAPWERQPLGLCQPPRARNCRLELTWEEAAAACREDWKCPGEGRGVTGGWGGAWEGLNDWGQQQQQQKSFCELFLDLVCSSALVKIQ